MENEVQNMEERILRVAEGLFMKQGLAKTTTTQIAREAGCNQALVHYYYRTKERLFEHVFEEKIRYIAGNIMAIDDSGGTLDEKIRRMVGAHFDFLMQNPLFVPFLAGELLANPQRFVPVLEKYGHYPRKLFARLDAELQREVARGTIRPIDTLDLVATVFSLNLGPFLVLSTVRKLALFDPMPIEEWLAARREENIITVLSRIKL